MMISNAASASPRPTIRRGAGARLRSVMQSSPRLRRLRCRPAKRECATSGHARPPPTVSPQQKKVREAGHGPALWRCFPVELHAVHGMAAMGGTPWDFAVLGFRGLRPGCRSKRGPLNDQECVARNLFGMPEQARIVDGSGRQLAVHRHAGPHHLAAIGLADRLMAKAHTQD